MAMDLDGRTNEFVDQFSLYGADAAKADGILAFRDGYKKAIADAAAVARDPYGDAVAALGPDEPLAVGEKIAAAIESLVKPAIAPPP